MADEKTWQLHWLASKTGAEWHSPPLTKREAEVTAESIDMDLEYRTLGIHATAERIDVCHKLEAK